jgi:hypothetical protein
MRPPRVPRCSGSPWSRGCGPAPRRFSAGCARPELLVPASAAPGNAGREGGAIQRQRLPGAHWDTADAPPVTVRSRREPRRRRAVVVRLKHGHVITGISNSGRPHPPAHVRRLRPPDSLGPSPALVARRSSGAVLVGASSPARARSLRRRTHSSHAPGPVHGSSVQVAYPHSRPPRPRAPKERASALGCIVRLLGTNLDTDCGVIARHPCLGRAGSRGPLRASRLAADQLAGATLEAEDPAAISGPLVCAIWSSVGRRRGRCGRGSRADACPGPLSRLLPL